MEMVSGVLEKVTANTLSKLVGNAFDIVPALLRKKETNPALLEPVYLDMRRCNTLITFVSTNPGDPRNSAAGHAIDFHYHGRDGKSETNKLHHVWCASHSTFR